MTRKVVLGLGFALMLSASPCGAQTLEYIGKPVGNVPISRAVKVGKFVFVGGTPGFRDGKVAAGDFAAQMKQVMENVTDTLKAAGAGWDRVVKTNVILTHSSDLDEMNRIYASYFHDGKYPARTTTIVAALPSPNFLVEIECEAVLE